MSLVTRTAISTTVLAVFMAVPLSSPGYSSSSTEAASCTMHPSLPPRLHVQECVTAVEEAVEDLVPL